jgi:hypothetical protein
MGFRLPRAFSSNTHGARRGTKVRVGAFLCRIGRLQCLIVFILKRSTTSALPESQKRPLTKRSCFRWHAHGTGCPKNLTCMTHAPTRVSLIGLQWRRRAERAGKRRIDDRRGRSKQTERRRGRPGTRPDIGNPIDEKSADIGDHRNCRLLLRVRLVATRPRPSSVMKWRRVTRSPHRRGQAMSPAHRGQASWPS